MHPAAAMAAMAGLDIPEGFVNANQLPDIIANILIQVDAKIAEESAIITGVMKEDILRDIDGNLEEKIGDKVRELGSGIDSTIKAEIKSIVDQRRQHEYRLQRRAARKVDFVRYVEFELKVDALRILRKQVRWDAKHADFLPRMSDEDHLA